VRRRRDPGNVRKHWRKVRDELGLEWVTPHVLRKTVATILDQEHDSATAALQLGHSGDAVTKRHYIEKRAVMGPDAREALDRAFGNRGAAASQSVG
jgi:integrase